MSTWRPQQLGDNWRPQQFGHWRTHGYEALGPSATDLLFMIMDGVDTITKLARKSGLSATVITGHVRRMTGMGIVTWKCRRGEPITSNVRELNISEWGGWWPTEEFWPTDG